MKVLFVKDCPTMFLQSLIYRAGILLGVITTDESKALKLTATQAKYALSNLDGGTDYWGSKPPRK